MTTFGKWDNAALMRHNARVAGKAEPAADVPRATTEARLHDEIIVECKRRGWYYVHARMDRPTTTALGVPDFIVAAKGGRTFWIEAKAARTKIRPEQIGAIHWLGTLGHVSKIVHSLQEFIDAIDS